MPETWNNDEYFLQMDAASESYCPRTVREKEMENDSRERLSNGEVPQHEKGMRRDKERSFLVVKNLSHLAFYRALRCCVVRLECSRWRLPHEVADSSENKQLVASMIAAKGKEKKKKERRVARIPVSL